MQDMKTAQQVAKVLAKEYPVFGASEANVLLVFDALVDAYPDWKFYNDAFIRKVIDANRSKLARDPEVQRAVRNVQANHSEIAWDLSTEGLLIKMAVENGDLSEPGLEFALAENAQSLPKSATAIQQAREQAQAERDIEETIEHRKTLILAHAKQKGNYRGQDFAWGVAVKRETARLLAMDLKQLRAEVSRRSLATKLAGMTKEDRRETVRNMTKAVEPPTPTWDQYPKMPPSFFPRGSFTPVPLNKEVLTHISKTDPEHFRMLAQKYGNEQIVARMREQD